jgi:hypothetical protein
MKENYYEDAIHILDLWHLTQHLNLFAKVVFNFDSEKYKPWVETNKEKFIMREYSDVIEEIKSLEKKVSERTLKNLKDEEKNCVKNFRGYVVTHISNIDCLQYTGRGLYIGSGHVENENKSVAQERLKRPGMMWNVESAQNLLSLRAKIKSNLWQEDVKRPVLFHLGLI